MTTTSPTTPVQVLLGHADAHGDRPAYEFLREDGTFTTLTYAGLLGRAAAVARRLREDGAGEGPALLLHAPGPDFVTSLWGCLLAGVPAVPAYPPLFGPSARIRERMARIVADSRAATVVAEPAILAALLSAGADVAWPRVVTPDPTATAEPDPRSPARPEDVALIQYTSGSTERPKGVVLDNGNLMANMRAISDVFGLSPSARVISWLPPYHDMGLIGFILTPVFGGFPARLMSPMHFLKNPLEWLRQISEISATHTGGPNFAYDLCVRRARGTDLSDIDLSTWRLAFNGAEPVRARTLAEFADRFAANGFRREAILPCYGLAEATLIVTGRHRSADDGTDDAGRVDCGPVIAGHDLAIVGRETGGRADDGAEGEIWVHGPSVSRGYLNAPEPADHPAHGDLDGCSYLRTGDLGYLRDGNLVVTGRLKDVLIQHGVNHHAHDLEAAAVEDNPAVRPTGAAFAVDDDRTLVLAVESLGREVADPDAVASDVRARVLAATGARLDAVVLCRPRSIPRTTSGKIRRRDTRDRFVTGELGGLTVLTSTPPTTGPGSGSGSGPVEQFLAAVFAGVCEVPGCAPTQSLGAIGGDSIRAAEISAVTEDALALPVPVADVLAAQTPRALTQCLLALWAADGVTTEHVLDRLGAVSDRDQPARA